MSSLKMSALTVVLILCLGIHAWSQTNLIPGDSSFETEAAKSCVLTTSGNGSIRWGLDDGEKYDGRRSLKLPSCGYAYGAHVQIPREQTNRVFTLSVYAKAEQDGVPGSLVLYSANGYDRNNFIMTREWKRYSVTSGTNNIKTREYWFAFGGNPTSSACWADAYQLEAGDKPTPYQNRDVNVGVEIPSEHDLVFFPDEPVKARIRALVRHPSGNSALLNWQVNDYYGRMVREGKKEVNLDGEGYGRDEFIITGFKPGFYALHVELNKKGPNVTSFVVVNPPEKIAKGLIPFCGILDYEFAEAGAYRVGNRWKQIIYDIYAVGAINCTWIKIEKTRGDYDWSFVDRELAANRHGYRVKLALWGLSAPEWAWDKAEVADARTKGLKIGVGCGDLRLLPSKEYVDDWRKFVRQLAERCKDKVDIIEFGAEDDGGAMGQNPYYLAKDKEYVKNGKLAGGPALERYAEMLSIACHETKQVAPNVKIGVIRPWECSQYTFSEAVLRQCGTNLEFDVFPLDCYAWPRYIGPGKPSVQLPDAFLQDALNKGLDLCRKYGRGQPVYISEYGYAWTSSMDVIPNEYTREMVIRLTRSYLIARMTKNVEFLHWYACGGLGDTGYGALWCAGRPLPSVAAYSAVARVVENVLESKEISGGNTKVVVFRKSNQSDAAIWLVKGEGKMILNNPPKDLTITDVMGSSVTGKITGEKTTIAIGEEPVYLSLPAVTVWDRLCNYFNLPADKFDRLCNMLASAELRVTPLRLQFSEPRAGKGVVILHNQTMQDLKAKVVCMVGDVSITNEALVAKGGKTEIMFDLPSALANHEKTIRVEADCGAGFEKVAESFAVGGYMDCKRVVAPITIDGECGEWQGRDGIIMNKCEQIVPQEPWVTWDGTNDLSAIVWTGWDETNFYFAAEVWDDQHFNGKTGAGIYDGDCLQMAFAPVAASDVGVSGYGPNDTEIGFALAQGKPETAQGIGTGTVWQTGNYTVKRDEAGKMTRYEAKIPWATLGITPQPGKVFGFNFVLFDDDTDSGQNYWYQLSPGITGARKNPALFKKFMLDM